MSSKEPLDDTIDFSSVGLQLEEDAEDTQEIVLEKAPADKKSANGGRFVMSPKPASERRNWKRFSIDGAMAMLIKPALMTFLKPTYVKLGPVKDIGMKGLALHYVDRNGDLNFKKSPYLSIMLPGEGLVVERVPFRVVNTYKVADLPGGKEVWNLCVSFEKLLPMQRMQIEAFIDDYGNEIKNKKR